MKTIKKTPENVEIAKALYATGQYSRRQVGEKFGVGESTIRQWMMTEAEYAAYKNGAVEWIRRNKDTVNARVRLRMKNATREEKDRRNAAQRMRYQNDPKVKLRMSLLAIKYRNTAQGTLGNLVRSLAHGHSSRQSRIWEAEITIITGMTRDQFTKAFNSDGVFDHIIPLCAFDLTNPQHFIRCCHPRNLRLISRRENEMKGKTIPDGLDVMSLPCVDSSEAIVAAQKLITVRLNKLNKDTTNHMSVSEMMDDILAHQITANSSPLEPDVALDA